MAHKTLINGTSYEVSGGRTLVNGTGYGIAGGRTLVSGTGHDVSFGTKLGTLPTGSVVYLNEGGSPVAFYVAHHNYESALNGSGRTLLVRKDVSVRRLFDESASSSRKNNYADNSLDVWFNGEYKATLDANVQSAIGETTFYYTVGNGNKNVTTLTRSIFALSVTEFGMTGDYTNVEGSVLDTAELLKIAYLNGEATDQWTRTPSTNGKVYMYYVLSSGRIQAAYTLVRGARPCFTLPSDTVFDSTTLTFKKST